jgi:hypothetical protein
MILGAHSIIYSRNPEADRAFLRDVFRLPHVDAGDGWLIFALPPAELAVHPSRNNDIHEFYFICADIDAFVSTMGAQGISCGPIQAMPWGRLTKVALPGGGKLSIYQALHTRPKLARSRKSEARVPKRPA